ncbi:MAG: dienelactone hydrolase family protein [Gemmatimonadetes bacterium]|nr:dienelactone hydrolase family protein [Gemmatimonadota bacterium]
MRTTLLVSAALATLSACSVQRWQSPGTGGVEDHLAHMSAADLSAGAAARVTSLASQSQGIAGLPASAVSAPARLAASPRHAEWVKIAWEPGSKDSLMAWIVFPVRRDPAPVVVVVHEIFGLQTWVRGVADQLAADGFIAIAPDLISRVRGGPSSLELSGDSARRLIGGVDFAERNRGIVAAANYAMAQAAAVKKYGVVGYCWGGSTVFGHVVHNGAPGFSGGVAYYGGFPFVSGQAPNTTLNTDSIAKIKAPIMLLNGSLDARIGASMPALDSLMRLAGKTYSGKNYEGAIHGFLRAQDDPAANGTPAPAGSANVAASRDAWPTMLSFFRQHLGR